MGKALHADDVVKILRAEAVLASGETADRVNAAADTMVSVQKRLQARLRDTTAKVLECRQKIAQYFSSRSQYRYRLRAVVVHVGTSANQGHYYCYVRHGEGWARCNDKVVTSGLSAAEVLNDAA